MGGVVCCGPHSLGGKFWRPYRPLKHANLQAGRPTGAPPGGRYARCSHSPFIAIASFSRFPHPTADADPRPLTSVYLLPTDYDASDDAAARSQLPHTPSFQPSQPITIALAPNNGREHRHPAAASVYTPPEPLSARGDLPGRVAPALPPFLRTSC